MYHFISFKVKGIKNRLTVQKGLTHIRNSLFESLISIILDNVYLHEFRERKLRKNLRGFLILEIDPVSGYSYNFFDNI